MGSPMTLSLYVGNHGKSDGIEDYIRLLGSILGDRGIALQISPVLVPGATNIVIDEFTNYAENRKLASFKREHPDSRLVFVLTEFLHTKLGMQSFNLFGGLRDVAAIALLNVYLPATRDDFPAARALDYVKAAVFAPLVIGFALPDTARFVAGRLLGRRPADPIRKFLQKNHRLMYFHWRYLGLKSCLGFADAVITSHEKIIDTFKTFRGLEGKLPRHIGVLYPEVDEADILSNLMLKKKLFVEMTGTITRYRNKHLDHVNRAIHTLGMHQVFGWCKVFPIATPAAEVRFDRGAFSLHPPQTKNWKYCSPMRIYRALAVEYNLPVLTRNFSQNPIEDVCFVWKDRYSLVSLYEMYYNPELLSEFLAKRLRAYNEVVKVRNDRCVEELRLLASKPPLSVVAPTARRWEAEKEHVAGDVVQRKLEAV